MALAIRPTTIPLQRTVEAAGLAARIAGEHEPLLALADTVHRLAAGRGHEPDRWRRAVEQLVAESSRLTALRTRTVYRRLAPYRSAAGTRIESDLRAARTDLEVALLALFRRLHGDAFERRPVDRLQASVEHALDTYLRLEQAWIAALGALPTHVEQDVARALARGRRRAPTRPHPYAPHDGRLGAVAFRLNGWLDRVKDTLDSRPLPRLSRAA